MNTDALSTMLKQSAGSAGRQAGCPDDYNMASYMDGGLSERDHERIELHLADCTYCIERVGILGRASAAETTIHVPELLRARAAKLASSPGPQKTRTNRRIWQRAPRWAAAAVVLVAIGTLFQVYSPGPTGGDFSPHIRSSGLPDGARATRNISSGMLPPRFLSPREGATLAPDGGDFSWTPVPDSLYYEVRIVSDEGNLIWQSRVNGTHWAPPAVLALSPGAEYFVRIEAYLAEAKSLKSDFLLFRVGERR